MMDWSLRARDLISRRGSDRMGEIPVIVRYSSPQLREDHLGYMVSGIAESWNGERVRGRRAFYLDRAKIDPRLGQEILRQKLGIMEVHSFENLQRYLAREYSPARDQVSFYAFLITLDGMHVIAPSKEHCSPAPRGPTYVRLPSCKTSNATVTV